MKKINLANVEEFKPFARVDAGGYVCGICAVEDVPDKEYLKITYDIIEGDLKAHYTNLKKDKGWDLPMFIASYKDSALSFFKGTITSIEKSNKGYTWDNDETKLKGKKIGLVLYEEEYVKNDGSIGVRMKVDKAHSIDAIKKGDFEVPERKCVNQSVNTTSNGAFGAKANTAPNPFADVSPFEETATEEFVKIPDQIEDDEFPFS